MSKEAIALCLVAFLVLTAGGAFLGLMARTAPAPLGAKGFLLAIIALDAVIAYMCGVAWLVNRLLK